MSPYWTCQKYAKLTKFLTSNAQLVDEVAVLKTGNNVVLNAESKSNFVFASFLKSEGSILELGKNSGVIQIGEDNIVTRLLFQDNSHFHNDYTSGIILG